jgi:hypothetical protein
MTAFPPGLVRFYAVTFRASCSRAAAANGEPAYGSPTHFDSSPTDYVAGTWLIAQPTLCDDRFAHSHWRYQGMI